MSDLTFSKTLPVAPKIVYQALTLPLVLEDWFADTVDIDLRPGGRFYAWWNAGYSTHGKVTEVKENEKLAFSWHGSADPAASEVAVSLAADGKGTKITVEHRGLGEGKKWTQPRKDIEEGWQAALLNLESALVRGLDKRIFDRPFLGIQISGALTAEQAKERGLDIAGGINLGGTLPGTGAEAAGLLNGDVIVSMAGDATPDFPALTAAIGKHKAGETVKVEYFRGTEKHTVDMKLSHRPVPEVSSDPKEFAAEIGKTFNEANKELAALFEGVSEVEAMRRPAETEWSAKETVAHLLMNEYWNLMNVSTEAMGMRAPNYANDLGSVAALAASFPTVADLLHVFERAASATVGALAAIPEDLQNRRYNVLNMAQTYQFTSNHTRSHFDQIRNAIAAAREQK
ncbi:MAG: PDZ domain-containing protein [Anaerolineae bacterium]|nr:MAG: PDZ domain-containing protein [Anaerolineae bacterium]